MALQDFIWFEKHRPGKLSELSLNKEHKKAFTTFIEEGEIPHLLLEGPQGSGKTTVSQILIDSIPCVVLALNASGNDRGISTVKGRVKQFAGSKVKDKLKIVFMDEADAVTTDAQNALKNTMETYSKSCRFILTCNHVDKINAPIQSRCMKFTFNQFPKRKLISLCENILKLEGVTNHKQEDIADIVEKFYPDVRTIVNSLQSACMSGDFNIKAIGSALPDPARVCASISEGAMLTLRTQVAGVTDFMFMYRYIVNKYIPLQDDPVVVHLMYDAVGKAVRAENTVPDREINFAACVSELMEAMEVPISHQR